MTSVPLTFLQRLDLGVTADRRSNPSINPPGLFGVYAEQPFFFPDQLITCRFANRLRPLCKKAHSSV
jgi:hypothetical protein